MARSASIVRVRFLHICARISLIAAMSGALTCAVGGGGGVRSTVGASNASASSVRSSNHVDLCRLCSGLLCCCRLSSSWSGSKQPA